jgi:hypothetical protein
MDVDVKVDSYGPRPARLLSPGQDRQSSERRGFWLVVGFLVLFAAAKPILFDTLDPDFFWHIRVGQMLSQMPRVGPIVDDLSYASIKAPWTPYSWLAELGMWKVWQIGGYRGVIFVQALIQATLALLLSLAALYATSIEGSKSHSRTPSPAPPRRCLSRCPS